MPLSGQLVFKSVIFSTNGYANRYLAKRGMDGTAAGTLACGALSGKDGEIYSCFVFFTAFSFYFSCFTSWAAADVFSFLAFTHYGIMIPSVSP